MVPEDCCAKILIFYTKSSPVKSIEIFRDHSVVDPVQQDGRVTEDIAYEQCLQMVEVQTVEDQLAV